MEDDLRWAMVQARRLADLDRKYAMRVRWTCVAVYVTAVALCARNGVSDAEMLGAAIAGLTLVSAFLSAGWITGGSWRD